MYEQVIANLVRVVINPLITLLFAVAGVVFLYGVMQFISAKGSGDTSGFEKGKQHMIWGIVGMAIILSAFAIKAFVCTSVRVFGDVPVVCSQYLS